ncbi:MAG: YhdH/YhfP family quinone oxidoreductase [Bacteroidetes bacterium]|nr:YhdH/YhfP family quinone oxidoreductase [Bacteroidota bacterium]
MNDSKKFKAMIVKEIDGKFIREIGEKSIDELPAGDVLISVKYSSLNFKDALSATGNKGVTRKYPHTPGIDAAGIIEESSVKEFQNGDEVVVTGFDLGMNTSGGFGGYIRVPKDWVVKLPKGLTPKESMIYGTAGFTAGLALDKLKLNGLTQSTGEVLVTGATGGVGSLAVAILSKAGYNVAAATGKAEKENFLKSLGAKTILKREEVDNSANKALLDTKWGGVIDTVGGNILATAIKSTKYNCGVAACGLTQSPILNSTVYPFILRGVNLLGIDSAHCDMNLRLKIWNKLANEWKPDNLDLIYQECSLEELNGKIDLILQGKITGRVVVKLNY